MNVKKVRLGWEESQVHYHKESEIQEKHMAHAVTKNQKKKAEVKIHNEWNEYLRQNELTEELGGFYKTVVVSND